MFVTLTTITNETLYVSPAAVAYVVTTHQGKCREIALLDGSRFTIGMTTAKEIVRLLEAAAAKSSPIGGPNE